MNLLEKMLHVSVGLNDTVLSKGYLIYLNSSRNIPFPPQETRRLSWDTRILSLKKTVTKVGFGSLLEMS